MCKREETKILSSIGVIRTLKNGKSQTLQFYTYICPLCKKITKTHHNNYTTNRCSICWSCDYTCYKFKNGSKILERSEDLKTVKYQCKCGDIYDLRCNLLRIRVDRGKELQCVNCSRIEQKVLKSNTDYNVYLRAVYKMLVKGADYRKIHLEITEEEVSEIMNQDCSYCGQEPTLYNYPEQSISNFKRNGIDRIDSELGYIKNNCIPCCKNCNSMKLNLRQKEFLEQVDKIYKHQHKNMIQTFKLNDNVILISNIDPLIEHFVIKPQNFKDKPSLWHRVGNGEISITTLPEGQWKIIDRLRNLDVSTDDKFHKVEAFRKSVKGVVGEIDSIDFENILIIQKL